MINIDECKKGLTENCKQCKHCHETKELVNKEWINYYICTLWLDIGENKEPLLLTLGDNADDRCEMWEGAEECKKAM